jgi:adenine-specific DNA methylase
VIDKARAEILETSGGKPPKVLDCFAGGGSIPLEALRLGCETYALELNPVAVLILKATLEYPQKFGKPRKVKEKAGDLEVEREINPLLEDVKKWGNWVLEEARKEIEKFYPRDPDGGIPVGYIWARTIKCQNPSCGTEIPLMRQFWLAQKDNKAVALKLVVDKQSKSIGFKAVQDDEIDFDPSKGTTSRATVLCPVCGSGIDDKTVRQEAQQGRMGQRMIAVVLHHPDRQGKSYRITEEDMEIFQEAEAYLDKKQQHLHDKWGIDPVPDEKITTPCHDVDRPPMYGMPFWGDLFNSRQKLVLVTFVDKVKEAHHRMLEDGYGEEYAKAVATYLALAVDRLADYNSTLCIWAVAGGFVGHTFSRQALPMVWDYFELNPFSGATGDWESALGWISRTLQHISQVHIPAIITQASSTSLSYANDYFDAVITDPPYYDNVGYANLSDFFYVWLKRTVGDLYPDLFATPLTPKGEEIVQDVVRHGGADKAKQFFEDKLTRAFGEIYRVLKPEGIACIVFAHTSTEAWETIINALLKSGLYLTGSCPIHTEMEASVVLPKYR